MKLGCVLAAMAMMAHGAIAFAQEGTLHAEVRVEREHIKEDCDKIKKLHSCAATLVIDHPFHIALGSIAPLNGFGAGPAFVINRAPNENWRTTFSADAVYAPGGAWRAGGYFKGIHTDVQLPQVVTKRAKPAPVIRVSEYPVFSGYVQAISLPNLTFYGIGANTSKDDIATYGLKETILGGSANLPLGRFASWRMSLFADANARMFDVLSGTHHDTEQLSARFTETTAPGLATEPAFMQIGEGVRLRPFLFNDRLQLRYTFNFQHFISPQSDYSFNRWTIDLSHEVPIYDRSAPEVRLETNSPNGCLAGPTTDKCPSVTRDRWGAFSVRMLASKAMVGDGGAVPFYLQRTLGGSDLDGNRALATYADYRFRGPHLILLQEMVERSIWGPFGGFLQAEQGKVAAQNEPLNFARLRHSATIGCTLRAGGFPMLTMAWGTGGPEGTHIVITMDTSLLGGGSRPSLH